MKLIVNSDQSLSKAIGALRCEFKEHKFVRLSFVSGKHRSTEFNALAFRWYKQVSDERGEMTPGQVHSFCKLHHGVPILRRDSEEFCAAYDASIKKMDYPTKLHVISMIPITSTFTNRQFKEYLEEIKAHFAELPTDPVLLEWPED